MATKRKSKNSKKKKNHVQVPFPVLLANVLVLVAVLGLSYMWLCSRCDALGREIKGKEAELKAAEKRRDNELERWTIMTSPPNLQRAIRKRSLDMVMPTQAQVVKVGSYDVSAATAMSGTWPVAGP